MADLSELRNAINSAYEKTGIKAEFKVTAGVVDEAALVLTGSSFALSQTLVRDSIDGIYKESASSCCKGG